MARLAACTSASSGAGRRTHPRVTGVPRPIAESPQDSGLPPAPAHEGAVGLSFGEFTADKVLAFDVFADTQLWIPTGDARATVMRVSASRVAQASPWLAQKLATGTHRTEHVVLLPWEPPVSGLRLILEKLYGFAPTDSTWESQAAGLAWLELLGVTPGDDHPWRSCQRSPSMLLENAGACETFEQTLEQVLAQLSQPWCAPAYDRWARAWCGKRVQTVCGALQKMPPKRFLANLPLLPDLGDKLVLTLKYRLAHKDPWPDVAELQAAFVKAPWEELSAAGLGTASALGLLTPERVAALFCKVKITEQDRAERAARFLGADPTADASESGDTSDDHESQSNATSADDAARDNDCQSDDLPSPGHP